MLITAYYRDKTNYITGLTFDTETKMYSEWMLMPEEYMHYVDADEMSEWRVDSGFRIPGDMLFRQQTQAEVFEKTSELINLGFIAATSAEMGLRFHKKEKQNEE